MIDAFMVIAIALILGDLLWKIDLCRKIEMWGGEMNWGQPRVPIRRQNPVGHLHPRIVRPASACVSFGLPVSPRDL